MAKLDYNNENATRNKKLMPTLENILVAAADACGIDTVSVVSGGQDRKGTPHARRKGSIRHDDGGAADVQLIDNGVVLDFEKERARFEAYVTAVARLGATGIGAGKTYMGTKTIHVGFGDRAVWGGPNATSAGAPAWLVAAVNKGWSAAGAAKPASTPKPTPKPLAKAKVGRNVIVSRDGLILRGGPGRDFERITALPFGTEVTIRSFVDGVAGPWAVVDLQDDGKIDGFMLAALLSAA